MTDFPKAIGFDLETQGVLAEYALQPCRMLQGKASISAASFAFKDKVVGYLSPKPEQVRQALQTAIEKDLYVIGWNVTFDAAWCIAAGLEKEVMAVKWLDAMLLWRHAVVEPEGEDVPRGKRKSYSLESALKEFAPEHAEFKEFKDFQAEDENSLELLLYRNKQDALWTLKLAEKFWGMLNDKQKRAALIEARCIPLCAYTKVHGIVGGKPEAEELLKQLEEKSKKIYAELIQSAPEARDINFGSPKQLQELLYTTWGLPAERFSKKTTLPSTDKYALFDLALLDPRAKMIKELREAKNNCAKYATGTLKSLEYNGDGKVRPQVRIFSTYCVPGSVEVLTEQGWARLDNWKGGNIVQAHENGDLEFLPAFRFDGPVVDEWIRISHQGIDCDFTEGHTIPYLAQKTYKWSTTHAGTLLLKENSQFDIPVAGYLKLERDEYSPLQMRIFCMAQADGWFSPEGYLKFTFKKKRKIERCKHLLDAEGLRYRVRIWPSYPDRTEIIIARKDLPSWIDERCKILDSWVFDAGSKGIEAFVDESIHWDGSPHKDGGHGYFSFLHRNLEWLSTMAHLTGRKAHIQKHDKVHISYQRPVSTIRGKNHCEKIKRSQQAFCATTETGFWLARSNGKIFITGNTSRMTYASSDKAKRLETKITKKDGEQQVERKIEVPVGIALHQWKRDKEYRRLIKAPEGFTLCEFDFSRQEFAWMAEASGDPTMLSLCSPDEDAHSYMGAQIARVDYRELIKRVHEEDEEAIMQRKVGKFSNLSFQYRVSVRTATTKARVDYELPVTEPFIQQISVVHKQTYSGIPIYWAQQILKCKQLGYAETFAGRRVQLRGSWAGREAWPLESTAINYPIQGTGGDQKYLALAVARNMLPEYGGYFYFELHDGLFFIFPDVKAARAIPVFKKALSNLPYKQAWGVDLRIKFPVDAKHGKNWGDLKEFK